MGANGSNGHQPVPEDAEPPLEAWVPGPGWQRRAAPPGRPRLDRRRLRLVLAGAGGALLLVVWTLAFTSGVRSVQPTVDDDEFLADAGDVCDRMRDRLAAEAAGRRG